MSYDTLSIATRLDIIHGLRWSIFMVLHIHSWTALILCVWVCACTNVESAYDQLTPPAARNPLLYVQQTDGSYRAKRVCVGALPEDIRVRTALAYQQWATAVGLPPPEIDPTCNREIWVRIDSTATPTDRCGWTTPWGVAFDRLECLKPEYCILEHEVGHSFGIWRHAPEGVVGPMSDQSRGDCTPSLEAISLLRWTYFGSVSR